MTNDQLAHLGYLTAAWLAKAPPHQTKAAALAQERAYYAVYSYYVGCCGIPSRRVMTPVVGYAPPPTGTGTR